MNGFSGCCGAIYPAFSQSARAPQSEPGGASKYAAIGHLVADVRSRTANPAPECSHNLRVRLMGLPRTARHCAIGDGTAMTMTRLGFTTIATLLLASPA